MFNCPFFYQKTTILKTFNNIQLHHHLQQEVFNPENLSHHHLSLLLGRDEVSYTITDEISKMVVCLKSFQVQEVGSRAAYRLLIKDVLTQEDLFKGNFNKVVIGIHRANYTLVPTAFLHQKNLNTFYHFNHLPKAETEVRSDEFDAEDMNTIYGVDMHLIALLQDFFGEFRLQHAITFLAKQLLVENRVYNEKRMYVNVEKRHVDILITEQSKLLFCNSYRYIMPEDFLYFVINAGNQNQVNFATNECILLGDIVHRAPIYQLCNQYITNLSFGNRPIAKKYCSEFNQLSKQHYYNLFSIY